MGVGIPATTEHIRLFLCKDRQDFFRHGGLGRCSHKVDRGPVEPFGGGFPVKAQPGAHHQLVDPVSQMGKAQIADRPNLIRCGVQMKIICHGIFSSKIEIIVDIR